MSRLVEHGSAPKAIIREATRADLPSIMALETSVFGAEAWSEHAMQRDMSDPNCVYIVAEIALVANLPHTAGYGDVARVVAYAGLLCPPGSGDGDIQTIAVAPEARGLGLGRALMLVLLQRAEERRANRLFLEVRADNEVAKALYVSLGFEEIAVRPHYYQPEGVDAIVMRREKAVQPTRGTAVGSEALS